MAFFCIIVTSCSVKVTTGSYKEQRSAAEKAIVQLHARMSDGRFEDIYSNTDGMLQRATSQEVLIAGLRKSHERYGTFVSSELKAVTCFPYQVRVIAHTQFSKGPATEMSLWVVHDGNAKLGMYDISPGLATVPVGVGNECR